jgi:hypothetical protein
MSTKKSASVSSNIPPNIVALVGAAVAGQRSNYGASYKPIWQHMMPEQRARGYEHNHKLSPGYVEANCVELHSHPRADAGSERSAFSPLPVVIQSVPSQPLSESASQRRWRCPLSAQRTCREMTHHRAFGIDDQVRSPSHRPSDPSSRARSSEIVHWF